MLTQLNLSQFTGTENCYRHFLGLLYSDGVKYLAEEADSYWLIDAIASYQASKGVKGLDFQFWKLKVDTNTKKAVLTCQSDSDTPNLVEQHISTDFPLEEVKFFLTGNVLYLPSEH